MSCPSISISTCPISSWSHSVLNTLLPPRCFGCGSIIYEHHSQCPDCWKKCSFLTSPCCNLCGWPFPFDTPDQFLCTHCHHHPPQFVKCRSALAYDDHSRKFILKFKQGDATYLAPALSKLMIRVGQEILNQSDFLIPVPLHWKRLFWRQYNQSSLLAHHLSRDTTIPTRTDLLIRHRSTPKQAYQSRKQRLHNVQGAFKVPKAHIPLVVGKRLTLIDDVFTTGATLSECARVLLKAGAKEIRVLTLARVIKVL